MKQSLKLILATLSAATALTLSTGCAKTEVQDSHDGHGHEENTAHTTTKNGVVMCTEHEVPEAKCAVCKPDLASKLPAGDSLKLRLPSTRSAEIVGVETALPESGPISDGVECMAVLSYDQNKLAQIAAPTDGLIQSVDVDLGSLVSERQVLAKLWSAPIAETVAKAVLAHQNLERERKLRSAHVNTEQDLDQAEANHRSACQQARSYGIDEKQIEDLLKKPDDPAYLELRSPFAGEIVERSAIRGALTDPSKALFTVADCSVMWAMIQVPEAALPKVKVGQKVELTSDVIPSQRFLGTLTWISPSVDERTRLARARAEFPNPDRMLRDKMFATARILFRETKTATLVPSSAIQLVEGNPFIFVKQDTDLFDARAVRLGARNHGRQEILEGLGLHEQVAVSHAFAIKSAMLMSHLGAGCADD